MKKSRLFAFLCAFVMLASCAPTKYLPKDIVANIDKVAVLAPLSYIDFMDEDGQFYPDDTLSAYSQDMLVDALMESELPVDKFIPVPYASLGQGFESTVASLAGVTPKQAPYLDVPSEIRTLLEENGERYGVLVFNTGFVRDIKGYRKELAKDVAATVVTTALAIFLGGSVSTYGAPSKNVSRMYAIIYDAQTGTAVYFNNTLNANEERNPLDPTDLRRQVSYLFKPLLKTSR